MANEYVTIPELKATLELSGESFADSDLTIAASAASRGLDNLCRRRFWPDADATQVRYYTPDRCETVEIDDLITLTTLKTDRNRDGTFTDTWTVNTDMVLEPLNAAADSRPYTQLTVAAKGTYVFNPGQVRSVQVTGKFGWAAVPAPVKDAAMILAGKLMRRAREAPFGVVSIGIDAGAVMRIARNDPDVMFLVSDYILDIVAVA